MPELDWPAVERKWQARWTEARAFEARADPSRPKWYANVPYPYMSGLLHIGFAATFLRAEIAARYRRMTGHNVLLPQAFHCTGLPILGAARRVAEGDEEQIRILRGFGIADADIPRFADPRHWIETFPAAAVEDLQRLGAAVDWSRSFITTSANPPYDAFVKWQFRRLREGGYVRLGKHPVIWCPRDQAPIGDHDRLEGDGETPVAFTLLKFPLEGKVLVAATLRPETVFGQTNLWVDPDVAYVEVAVGEETWVLSRQAAEKLGAQEHAVAVKGEVPGRSLLGKTAVAPMIHRPIPILPGAFLDQERGTGIVTSVPSDAPDDWIALEDLKRDEDLARFGLDAAAVRAIDAIPIIRSEGWGPLPAREICERLRVRSQADRELLQRAKEEIYRTGFYTGVMRENCGAYAGQRVEIAKEAIRAELLATGEAAVLHEPSGRVVCRCGAVARVQLVEGQWFLAYGDEAWKARARELLARMRLYPEAVRGQMEHVIAWLHDWACTHHHGLGTTLPWDEGWVIESLSDSTIYMAYYTVAHALQGGRLQSAVPWASKVDDAFFDHVFRGQGDGAAVAAKLGLALPELESLRREFTYWYPFDLRNSGKDLVHNHMTFFLFTHAALFPEAEWPRGLGVNGFVSLSGAKMSKSRGNTILLRDAIDEIGADVVRITLANGAEGLDDPNFDADFAASVAERLRRWHAFATHPPAARAEPAAVDAWFRSRLHRCLAGAAEAMEGLNHRTALKRGFFDLQAAWEWYVQRCGTPHRVLLEEFVRAQTLLLAPFVPHLAEEVWERLGGPGFASHAAYPKADPAATDAGAEAAEAYVEGVLGDARAILKIVKRRPEAVRMYVAPAWKVRAYALGVAMAADGPVEMKAFMAKAQEVPELRERMVDLANLAKKLVESLRAHTPEELRSRLAIDEAAVLGEASAFLGRALGAPVSVEVATREIEDLQPKARQAAPWRPAIVVT
jgi:leucyl-tRNA synthetase